MALTLIIVATAVFLVGTSAGVVAVASLASLREDHAHSMGSPADTRLTRGVRALTGLHVRTPASLYVRTSASTGPSPSPATAPAPARPRGTRADDATTAGQPRYATLHTVRLTWPVA
jgi:hypothetical protein